ncbi:MAG TPA: hypothetical protein VJN71_11310 [Nitrososphaerales archaeon]|nr:hypothetical protein [Nitrososphaerales archaeon]
MTEESGGDYASSSFVAFGKFEAKKISDLKQTRLNYTYLGRTLEEVINRETECRGSIAKDALK